MKKINLKVKKVGIIGLAGLSLMVLLCISKIITIGIEQNHENNIKKTAIEEGRKVLFVPDQKLFDKDVKYVNILPQNNNIIFKTITKKNISCPNQKYLEYCKNIENFLINIKSLDIGYIKLLPQQEIIIMEIEKSRKWKYYYSIKKNENIHNKSIKINTGRQLQS